MAILTVTNANDNGAGSLRAAITAAQTGDTIQFASTLSNQTIVLTSGQLVINPGKNLTINGSGATNLTISGNNASRIFQINSNQDFPTQLNISNLTLANAYTNDQGGAIKGEHKASVTVNNVNFNNNVADNGGGAIFTAWETNLTVTNSRFNGNQAVAGNDERGAGAIAFLSPGSLIVRDSEFTNNRGINGGAINSLNGKLTIENTRFLNNDTIAAVYDTGQPNPSLRGYGGAIFTDRASSLNETSGTIRITNSIFEGNRGRAEGGGAYLYTGTQDSVTIEGSSFRNNEVLALPNGGNDGNGGGLVVMSNGLNQGLNIRGTSFVGNTAANQGGGLWLMGAPTTITNSTFSSNRTLGTDYNRVGGAMALYSATNIINTTIADNHAGWVGGGISAVSDAAVSVRNTIFSNNTADNGTNNWGVQQHVNRQLTDNGGNIQWPPKFTNNWNDYNVTATITLADPKLGLLQNLNGAWVYPLLADSPAINSGVTTDAPNVDQRGLTRDANPDIGSYEVIANPPVSTPNLSISNVTFLEGNGTTTNALFTVTLSAASNQTVTVAYTTNNNTALAGSDYTATSGTLTFNAGVTTQNITVAILNDSLNEIDETFLVTLSNPTNATLSTAIGTATITDTLKAAVTTTLSTGVENLTLTGIDNINGTGNAGNNVIIGNNGNNTLAGGSGKDSLNGSLGNDSLNGGQGEDLLTGGLGNDTYVFYLGQSTVSSLDRITDFAIGSDKIDLLTSGGAALNKPISLTRAANSTAGTRKNLVNQVFADANGELAGKQALGTNAAALVQVTSGGIAGTYLIINNESSGFQANTDLLINITGYSGSFPDLGTVSVDSFFI